MTSSSHPLATGGEATAEKRFLALNRDRMLRVREALSRHQRDFLDALPLLFHANHPLLPGFVSSRTPYGIVDWAPTQNTLSAARRLCRSYEYDRRAAPRHAVRGLYLMGSPGTVAYSRTSDLDMWLVHASWLDEPGIADLTKKAESIERYAADLGLEVHFFVFDADRFRAGETLDLSDESSGSSQRFLLLDEFYRSSLLLAGLPPLWWRVPADHDHDYRDYVKREIAQRRLDLADYIDFGELPTIPPEEFFGAAVWQLYKSIHAPYKSVLKLLLMETYATAYPDVSLLSARFKQNVESRDVDLNALDPYILMYTVVEEHLMATNDPVRLDVLRRSFYLKANLKLSQRSTRITDDWRREALQSLVTDWGWDEARVAELDRRDQWGLNAARKQRGDLLRTLRSSYALLSHFARHQTAKTLISESDLQTLGHKLLAAFEKRPSKIEQITRGICPNPLEQSLTLMHAHSDEGQTVWSVFAGTVTPAEADFRKPMHRSASAVELVLWCLLNGLADLRTTWHVFGEGTRLDAKSIRRILDVFATKHAPAAAAVASQSDQRRINRIVLLINTGVNPFAETMSSGSVLTSNRNDPFAYGARALNLVRSIDLVYQTSWDETFVHRYEGGQATVAAVAECLQWFDTSGGLPVIEAHCVSAESAHLIARRVREVFSSALTFAARWKADAVVHYVMQCDEQLHHLRATHAETNVLSHNGQAHFIRAMGDAAKPDNHAVRFDPGCRQAGLLPHVFDRNQRDKIQIFAHQRGESAYVFVLDDRGLPLTHRQECVNVGILLQHYRLFLSHTIPRCQAALTGTRPLDIETVAIKLHGDRPEFTLFDEDLGQQRDYLALEVFADADDQGHQQFTIVAGHREFSTWEHGGSLFVQVADFVRSQRAGGMVYPIYITDLDLSLRFRRAVGMPALRPYDMLNYKKRIEFQLTKAMLSGSNLGSTAVDAA